MKIIDDVNNSLYFGLNNVVIQNIIDDHFEQLSRFIDGHRGISDINFGDIGSGEIINLFLEDMNKQCLITMNELNQFEDERKNNGHK